MHKHQCHNELKQTKKQKKWCKVAVAAVLPRFQINKESLYSFELDVSWFVYLYGKM